LNAARAAREETRLARDRAELLPAAEATAAVAAAFAA
jgi:hypothetical protein